MKSRTIAINVGEEHEDDFLVIQLTETEEQPVIKTVMEVIMSKAIVGKRKFATAGLLKLDRVQMEEMR